MGIQSGLVVPDETTHGNDLYLKGTGYTLGAPGGIDDDPDTAIRFNGLSSYAVTADGGTFAFANGAAFSVECWASRDVPADGAAGGGLFDSSCNWSSGGQSVSKDDSEVSERLFPVNR